MANPKRAMFRRSSALALGLAVQLTVASAAFAQVQATSNAAQPNGARMPAPAQVDEVVVTATRVQRTNFTAPTPTIVLGRSDIEKTGATNIGQITAQAPAFQTTATPATSTLSSDTGRGNFLDLRGLGPSRTLVLVDGRRFVPTTSTGLVDTDVIPAAIIDHIEVVTGGASASWGSDAVAGVVNVILNRKLEGLQGDVQGGVSQRGDNREFKGSLAFGTDFAGGRGHLVIAGEATDNDGVLHQSDRPWSAKDWGLIQTPQFNAVQSPNARLSIASFGGLILTGSLAGQQFGPGGVLQPFHYGDNVGSLYMQGGDGAVFAPYTALEEPLRRQNVFTTASYELTPDITASLDLSYGHAVTDNPNLVQNFDLPDVISVDNAFLPTAVRDQLLANGEPAFLLGRLDNDFGFIRSRDDNRVWRGVAALDGRLGGGWTWNAYYEYGHVEHDNVLSGVVRTDRYAQALDSVIDPATGAPTCRSTLTAPGDGCVPIDIFGVGAPSAAAIGYVTGTETTHTVSTENAVAASLQGHPFSTWAGPVSVALGGEYRRESVNNTVDAAQEAGVYLIGDGHSFSGANEVEEGFLEVVAPLLSDAPFAKAFDLDLGVRATNYSSSGYVTTWKAGASWTVTDELRLRATRSRDIRAPNLSELYQTGSLNFTNVNDPANGGQSDFIRNPAPPNPNLKPEAADTLTLGAIYEPSWLSGLRLAVDYYDIRVRSMISQLNAQEVVNRCFAGDAALCGFVVRDSGGTITEVDTPNINLSHFSTSGLDIEAAYRLPMSSISSGWNGGLSLRLMANYVRHFSVSDGVSTVDEAGAVGAVNLPSNIGAVEGVPHWRADASITYDNGPLTLYLEGRYVGGGKLDNLYGPSDVPVNHSPARFYANASVQYTLYNQEGRRIQLYAVVDNLFDQDPPIIVGNFIAPFATNPQLYDVIGRTFSVGVRFKY